MVLITIDPGKSGAFVYWTTEDCAAGLPPQVYSYPKQEKKICEFWKTFVSLCEKADMIVMEHLWSTPQRHHRANWVLGCSYGAYLACIHQSGKFDAVKMLIPSAWEKLLPLQLPKEYNARKRAIRDYATVAFPKATLANGDAIAMMIVCMNKYGR